MSFSQKQMADFIDDEEFMFDDDELDQKPKKSKKGKKEKSPKPLKQSKKDKEPSGSRTESGNIFFKTKNFIGVCLVVVAAIVAFGVMPVINVASNSKTTIVVAKEQILKGTIITKDMITTKTVGSYGIANDVLADTELAIDQYANTDILVGDMLTKSKVSIENPLKSTEYLMTLGEGKQAMSISLPSLEISVAGAIRKGDIISCYCANTDTSNNDDTEESDDESEKTPERDYASILPPELKYIKVLDVNSYQASALAGMSNEGNLHLSVVYRGGGDKAAELLAEQEKFFKTDEELLEELVEREPPSTDATDETETTEQTENSEVVADA